MLRTRILLIALAIVTLIVGLFGYGAWLRERAANEEHELLRLALVGQAWELLSQAAIDRTAVIALASFDHDELVAAVESDSQALLQSALGGPIEEVLDTTDLVRFDLVTREGELLFSSDAVYFATRLFGVDRPVPLNRDDTVSGVRINGERIQGLTVVPVFDGAGRVASIVLTVDLEPALDHVADLLGADVVVLDRSGRPLDDGIADLYAHALERIDPVSPQLMTSHLDDSTLEFATATAVDAGGGRSGTVVAITDISATAEQGHVSILVTVLWAILAAVVPLGLLWLYLSRAFRPLDDAVDALSQLSRGRTDHYVELRAGDDEIGQIGRAVEVFRENTLQVERQADLEERRRRRQARFIRRQMTTLGETLDEEGRASAMEDLRQIELMGKDSGAAPANAPEFSDQLGLIGIALERMTARVRTQQQDMNKLIAELREALRAKTRLISLEQELEVARQMQLNVLPRAFPQLPGFSLAARMRPAREVGGDFYDVFRIDERRTAIAIADVSGKGIPAAFFMLITRTLLKALALEGRGPARTVSRLNELLSAENEEMMFVTLFYAELDPVERRLTYANCGHNEPILVASDGPAAPLPSTDGMALAVFEDLSFEEETIELAPNSALVLFTDGVTEAFDSDGHMFSDGRLIGLLDELHEQDASAMLTDILQAVDRFSGEAPQSDDITLMVLSALGQAAAQSRNGRQQRVAAAE